MAKLPTEIATDILCRLPAKSLVRFTCASKEWSSLLSDPHFLKLYCYQRHQDQNLELVDKHGLLYAEDLDSPNSDLRIDYLLQDSDFKVKKVLGLSNNLLCLSVSSKSYTNPTVVEEEQQAEEFKCFIIMNDIIVICNISTGARHIVPPSPIYFHPKKFSMVGWVQSSIRHRYGFGFDASVDDYKLVRIYHNVLKRERHREDHDVEVKVYSMKTNSWSRSVDQHVSRLLNIGSLEPVLVDGVLYRLATTDQSPTRRILFGLSPYFN